MMERRTARRYELYLPVNIRTLVQTDPVTYNGKTRDISNHGVYFTTGNNLNVGAELDLTVTLPAEVTRGPEVLVRIKSTVLRVDKSSANGDCRVGVAALFKRYDIVRNESVRS
jgi:c-di-GMP-binding flagellar brake protein YcgR